VQLPFSYDAPENRIRDKSIRLVTRFATTAQRESAALPILDKKIL
jgi:hypothetical protein